MIEWYKKVVFENYANFNGRARRSEYWYFLLTNFIILMGIVAVGFLIFSFSEDKDFAVGIGSILYLLYSVAVIIPSLAVAVRRLHDVGKSGWFYFICLIPAIGGLWLLILFFTDSQNGVNEYGANPKNELEEINEIGILQN
jgi:uncharacterized membrane protein YhaH (DUF805 family)